MVEQPSHEDRKKTDKKSHIKRIVQKRIPKRFLEILISEVLISLILLLLIEIEIISPGTYVLWLWIALILFWLFIWKKTNKSKNHTASLKEYYFCNLTAYFLFVVIAAIVYMFDRYTGNAVVNTLTFRYFRLSYVLGLSDDKSLDANEIIPSFLFFYGSTLLIILIVPHIRKLKRKLSKSKGNSHSKHHSGHHHHHHHHEGNSDESTERNSSTHHSGHHHHHHHHHHHEEKSEEVIEVTEKDKVSDREENQAKDDTEA